MGSRLELCMVRGCVCERCLVPQALQQRGRQRGALSRVGAAAHLVQQDQGLGTGGGDAEMGGVKVREANRGEDGEGRGGGLRGSPPCEA